MKHAITSIFFLLVASNTFAQVDSILAKARDRDAFEEIFVHTDKDNYVTGESIWLKAYLYDGLYPSSKSTSLKIQLVTTDSSVIDEKIYPVVSGIANGNIKLPANINTGNYFLRAVGNASLSAGLYSITPLIISNPTVVKKVEPAIYNKVASIHFNCPGGLVAGQLNDAFVSVADQYQQPLQTTGFLIDGENDTVTTFSTNALGIDELHIVPQLSENYTLALAGGAGKLQIPASSIKEKGISMTVYLRDADYNIVLSATPDLADKEYNLVAEYNYNLLTSIKVHFNNNGAAIKIPAAQLPAGITRLVLLTPADDAVCERYIFSANTSGLMNTGETAVKLSNSDTTASAIKFIVNDTVENTISVGLVNSAYNFGSIYKDENIINRFLLTGWFKDYNTAYSGLIDNLAKVDAQAINGLVATQQLVKPAWQQVKQLAQDNTVMPFYGYIDLKGTVTPDGYKSLPKPASLTIIFSAADSSRNFSVQPLDEMGRFAVNDMAFSDSITMFYKLNTKTPHAVKLNMEATSPADYFKQVKTNWHFLNAIAPVQVVAVTTDVSSEGQKQKQILLGSKEIAGNELANVTVHTVRTLREKTKALNDKYTTTVFSREASATYNMLEEPVRPGQNVIDFLRMFGRRMTITQSSSGDGNILKPGWGAGVPYTLFADEGRTTFGYLLGLDLSEVALIKIYEDRFILADNNGPAIAVYLRKGGDNIVSVDPQMQKVRIAGYSPVKNFVNPGPENAASINSQALLSTFYWNPNVSLSKFLQDGIQFYNINKVQKAQIVLQGMGSDGKLVYWKETADSK